MPSSLIIGINALYLIPGKVGGTEIYLRSLLRALSDQDTENAYVVFLNQECANVGLVPTAKNFRAVVQPVSATLRPIRIIWEQTGLIESARRHRLNVLLNPGFTAPWWSPCPTVSVFHDLQHVRHPEYFRRIDLPFWRLLLRISADRSAAVIVPSEATAEDFHRIYCKCRETIHVVPHGVDEEFYNVAARRCEDPRHPYLLSVSTLHPHKNLDRLIRAFARLRAQLPQMKLVMVGLRGFAAEQLVGLISQLDLGNSVRITGWVPRKEVYDLFAGASGFIYPSTFEGFGLPLLEAMAAGVPGACSDIEPLRGIACGAMLLFDPHDDTSILRALERLTCDTLLRETLVSRGRQVVLKYSWNQTAAQTLRVLTSVTGPRR